MQQKILKCNVWLHKSKENCQKEEKSLKNIWKNRKMTISLRQENQSVSILGLKRPKCLLGIFFELNFNQRLFI